MHHVQRSFCGRITYLDVGHPPPSLPLPLPLADSHAQPTHTHGWTPSTVQPDGYDQSGKSARLRHARVQTKCGSPHTHDLPSLT